MKTMLFSERDIDALRLLCWCQYIQPKRLIGIITETELQNLIVLGFAKCHEKSGALVLTAKGFSFLQSIFQSDIPVLAQSYHKTAIQRRLQQSMLALTAYRGPSIFSSHHRKDCLLPSLWFYPLVPEDTA